MLWLGYVSFILAMVLLDGERPVPETADGVAIVVAYVGMAIAFGGFTLPALITLIGAVQMLRVRGYYWCWAGAVLGALPCTIFCFVLSLPFAIWGMAALYDARMRMAFAGGSNPFVAAPRYQA